MKAYAFCDLPECDARMIYDDFQEYASTRMDEREATTESDNDRLFQAYTSAISVLHKYWKKYPDDVEAKRWLDKNVSSYYGKEK